MITYPQREGKNAAQAHLLATIKELLDGPPRCLDRHRQLHVFRSILIGRGPTCLRKRSGGTK
jgi:hypothetical protein